MSRKRKRAIATDSMRAMVAMSAAQQRAALPSIEDIRKRYAPPVTLGCSDEDRKSIDLALDAAGVYSVLRHSLTGASFACFPQFMGYGALQNLAQNGMIRACVSTVADDMTREWVEIRRAGEKGDRIEDDELVSSLSAAMEQMCLKKVFHEAVELVGYEGGALIFVDTGAKDTQLALPLDMSPKSAELRKGCSLRFVVIDPVNVAPGTYNADDPLRADYFRPRDWLVLGRRVHASRLIRLVSNEVPILLRPAYNFFGVPQAQILWDYVQHFQENRTAVDRLLTKFSMTVFKTAMFEGGAPFGPSDQVRMDERIKFMVQNMSNDGILAVDKNAEDVVKLETPLSGLTDIVRQSLELLAAINRTPAVKLLGISPSGFNATGESDLRNYYDHIASMQHKQLFDGIKRVIDCLQLHLYGQIDPNISFRFNVLNEEDKQVQASTRKTRMETLSLLLDRDVISVEEARKALSEDPDSGFDDIDPELVPEPQGMPDAGEEDLLGEQGLAGMEAALPSAAMDEAEWRTARNGKRYQIDTETGEVKKGNLGQKQDNEVRTYAGVSYSRLQTTNPDTARYNALLNEKNGNYQAAAHEYFKENFQGKYMNARVKLDGKESPEKLAPVCFTGGTWQELKKGMRDDPVKAELLPHIADIISSGDYNYRAKHKERTDDAIHFHEYSKVVPTSIGSLHVVVDVQQRKTSQPPFIVYNLTQEGSWGYKKRFSEKTSEDGITAPASGCFAEDVSSALSGFPGLNVRDNTVFDESTMADLFEIVNIRYERV